MAYRESFTFTTTEALTDFTVECGNFVHTFYPPFTNESYCIIPDDENFSDCNQKFTITDRENSNEG